MAEYHLLFERYRAAARQSDMQAVEVARDALDAFANREVVRASIDDAMHRLYKFIVSADENCAWEAGARFAELTAEQRDVVEQNYPREAQVWRAWPAGRGATLNAARHGSHEEEEKEAEGALKGSFTFDGIRGEDRLVQLAYNPSTGALAAIFTRHSDSDDSHVWRLYIRRAGDAEYSLALDDCDGTRSIPSVITSPDAPYFYFVSLAHHPENRSGMNPSAIGRVDCESGEVAWLGPATLDISASSIG